MSNADAPIALVVDDDSTVLTAARLIIEKTGFRSFQAETVAEAVNVLEQYAWEITLLFTDVEMPGGRDGFELARETARRWPDISILVASANRRPAPGDLPDEAMFIDKPFSGEVVRARLQELLPEGEKPEPLKRERH